MKIKSGTALAAEYDPESQWFAVITTIAAHYLKANGRVGYMVFTRPPEDLKRNLSELGADVLSLQREKRLQIYDWYSASLTGGRVGTEVPSSVFEKTSDGFLAHSIKVADLSVQWLKDTKYGLGHSEDLAETWLRGALAIGEATSTLLRFNEERDLLEWIESRVIPIERRAERVAIWGFVRGIHSDSFYKCVEAICGGVTDLQVMERDEGLKNFLRVRSLKGQPHDSRWHEVQVSSNGEAILVL